MKREPKRNTKSIDDIKVIVENMPSQEESKIILQKLSGYLSKVWKEKDDWKSPQD